MAKTKDSYSPNGVEREDGELEITVYDFDDTPAIDGTYIVKKDKPKSVKKALLHIMPGKNDFESMNRVERVLLLLGILGEMPRTMLKIIDDEYIKRKIHDMSSLSLYKNDLTGEVYQCKALNISGSGKYKVIHLSKGGKTILKWLNEDLYNYYCEEYKHKFSSYKKNLERSFRNSEVAVMLYLSGATVEKYRCPKLAITKTGIDTFADGGRYYYKRKDIPMRSQCVDEKTKDNYSRCIGAIFSKDMSYAVYNTRGSVIKIHGFVERKFMVFYNQCAAYNNIKNNDKQAILFCNDYLIALDTIRKSETTTTEYIGNGKYITTKHDDALNKIFSGVYAVTLDNFGKNILRILLTCNWREKMFDVFGIEKEEYRYTYDCIRNNKKYYMFIDSDISRLINTREYVMKNAKNYIVVCFVEQKEFINSFYEGKVEIKLTTTELVYNAIAKQ